MSAKGAPCIAFARCEDIEKPWIARLWKLNFIPLRDRFVKLYGVEPETPVWGDPDVDWGSYDLVHIRCCYDYTAKFEKFSQWLDELINNGVKTANSASLVYWNMDKHYIKELSDNGIPLADFIIVDAGSKAPPNLAKLMVEKGWTAGLVVKPTIGSCGYHNKFFYSQKEAAKFQVEFEQLVSGVSLIVQKYLPGIQEKGEWSFFFVNHKLSHVRQKFHIADKNHVMGQVIPVDWQDVPMGAKELAHRVLETVGKVKEPPFYARIDVIESEPGMFWLMEAELLEPNFFLEDESNEWDVFLKELTEEAQRARESRKVPNTKHIISQKLGTMD